MSVKFYFEDIIPFRLPKRDLKKWFNSTVENENKKIGDIVYILCSDAYLLQINREFLNHDYLTDIITFDYVDEDTISGDIFISYERVMDNSSIYNVSVQNELLRVMIHGILHLIGFKDKTVEELNIIRKKEDFYISMFK